MPDALIVSSGEKGRDTLREALSALGVADTAFAASGTQARRAFPEADWRLILINTPLADEFGRDLAVFAAEQTGAGVVLLVKAELADEAAAHVEEAGVFVVPKPMNRALAAGAVRMALAVHWRIARLRRQNDQLRQRIEEIRLVDRAKCALVQYCQMTEPQAHRSIEQRAMDSRRTRREVAQEILARYEGEDFSSQRPARQG